MTRPGLPKLIATDLDGTLVRSDDTVSAYTHEVLDRVRAAGIPIVGATGRGPRLTELTRNDIRDADFLVMAGGGRVVDQTDPAGPVVLRDERLPGRVLARLLADLEAAVGPLTVMVEALDEHDAPLWGDPDPAWRYPDRFEARARADCLAGDVIKAFARDRRPRRRRAAGGRRAGRPAAGGHAHPGRARLHRDLPARRRQGHRAGGGGAGRSASTRPTCWSSATCPTTCRCSPGPAGAGWRWPTRTRWCGRPPTRSP